MPPTHPAFPFRDQPMNTSTITRRRLLQAGGLGALSLATPGIVTARVGSGETPKGAAEKSCIFILLCGGPSPLDTWDPKAPAPAEVRGPHHPHPTPAGGGRLSASHPRQ